MAFSLKVLAVKHCFLSHLEFSALIISSYFWKLFMESIALVSLHVRQNRKPALYRRRHRADLFNILLRNMRDLLQTTETWKTPLLLPRLPCCSSSKVSEAGCTYTREGKSPPKDCLACGESSPSPPYSEILQKASFSSAVSLPSLSAYKYAQIKNMAFRSLNPRQAKHTESKKPLKRVPGKGRKEWQSMRGWRQPGLGLPGNGDGKV